MEQSGEWTSHRSGIEEGEEKLERQDALQLNKGHHADDDARIFIN
jgi:hypothetical protein